MLDFPGTQLDQNDDAIIVTSAVTLRALSSAVVGGGSTETRTIVNRYVSKDYQSEHPAADLAAYARSRGVDGAFIGLLTAVPMRKARAVTLRHHDLTVAALVTGGVGNASAAGLTAPYEPIAGTINLIVLIDGQLSAAAMVNAVITATEAKTAVLFERDTRTADGHRATGTSTDTVVIACARHGETLTYAGPVTPVGYLIGQCVRASLEASLDAD